ncbi:MAG: hypothetical protein QNJ72_09980 [Pleurocapsa sp. MO_226.B13]|nr:hypothetical protein [Pleurocapsa sp. MO_226.B13]
MIKHYILNLNPQANSDWDRCLLRNPITGERPDLIAEIAKAVNNQGGSYLIEVDLQVKILEQNLAGQSNTVELPTEKNPMAIDRTRLAS